MSYFIPLLKRSGELTHVLEITKGKIHVHKITKLQTFLPDPEDVVLWKKHIKLQATYTFNVYSPIVYNDSTITIQTHEKTLRLTDLQQHIVTHIVFLLYYTWYEGKNEYKVEEKGKLQSVVPKISEQSSVEKPKGETSTDEVSLILNLLPLSYRTWVLHNVAEYNKSSKFYFEIMLERPIDEHCPPSLILLKIWDAVPGLDVTIIEKLIELLPNVLVYPALFIAAIKYWPKETILNWVVTELFSPEHILSYYKQQNYETGWKRFIAVMNAGLRNVGVQLPELNKPQPIKIEEPVKILDDITIKFREENIMTPVSYLLPNVKEYKGHKVACEEYREWVDWAEDGNELSEKVGKIVHVIEKATALAAPEFEWRNVWQLANNDINVAKVLLNVIMDRVENAICVF